MTWDLLIAALCGFGLGAVVNQEVTRWLQRKRRRILSNWEPGMTITMADGETLYVCAVEPTDSPRKDG